MRSRNSHRGSNHDDVHPGYSHDFHASKHDSQYISNEKLCQCLSTRSKEINTYQCIPSWLCPTNAPECSSWLFTVYCPVYYNRFGFTRVHALHVITWRIGMTVELFEYRDLTMVLRIQNSGVPTTMACALAEHGSVLVLPWTAITPETPTLK